MLQRRTFLCATAAALFTGAVPGCSSPGQQWGRSNNDWALAESICQQIAEPQFPKRDFVVENYGAIADGNTDCTDAFRRAIKACAEAGGGRVLAAGGVYKTGAIHLKSNVNLHIGAGATLSFTTDPKHYLPAVFTRWEGMEMMGYSPLIYAYGQENIAVTGAGTLDGNADDNTWWPWKGPRKDAHWNLIAGENQAPARARLQEDTLKGVPVRERVYAQGAYLRPPFIQPYACRRVLIEGVTIVNAPFWLLHPVLCEGVTVRGVTCRSHGPNNDGCDPESCKNVVIENCLFDTGDDCIALKSGRNEDGRRLATAIENVVIRNCRMRDGHGGLVLGSEISGGARNIFLENCEMTSENLERAIRIKTNARRGGLIEHIRVRNVHVGRVRDAVVVNFHYEEGADGEFKPVVRDVLIEGLVCKNADRALYIRGFEHSPVGAFRIENSNFLKVARPSVVEHAPNLQLVNVLGDIKLAEPAL